MPSPLDGITVYPLNPGDWPQDNLRPPVVPGMLSRLDRRNVLNVRREYYSLTGKVTLAISSSSFPKQAPITLNVPAYGDFWINSIACYITASGNNATNSMPLAKFRMTDVRSNYTFFDPYMWIGAFTGMAPAIALGISNDDTPLYSPVTRSALPLPYCVTRNNALLCDLEMITGTTPRINTTYYLVLDGWLEYENAV